MDLKFKTPIHESKSNLFPKSWKKLKIKNICHIRRDASPRPIQNFIQSFGIPWVKISDATNQKTPFIEWTREYINKKGKSHTVMNGSINFHKFWKSRCCTIRKNQIFGLNHDGWLLLRKFNEVDKIFLYYFFINERPNLVGIADGTVFKNLKIDIVLEYDIFLPSLFEQEKIGKILLI